MAKDPEQTPAPRRPPPNFHPVFVFPTPDKRDLLFYVEVDGGKPDQKPGQWAYGDTFKGPPAGYQDYKLVHVSEQTSENWERRWYAKDWQDQDAHNWVFTDGDQLIRTYLVPRASYRQRKTDVADPDTGEFLYPPGGTRDTVYTGYGFVNDTVSEAPDPLKGLYIIVQRRFAVPVQTNTIYDDTLEKDITITREIVDKVRRASQVLTSTGVVPLNGTTVTAGGKTYTFQTILTNVDGNVLIGGSAAIALDNLRAAINRSAGAGTRYAAATTANTLVSCSGTTDTTLTVEALLAGPAGDAITVSDSSAVLSWGSTTLAGGSGSEIDASEPGTSIELQYGDFFHDVKVTTGIELGLDADGDPETYPVTMTSYLTDIQYRFPQLMRAARMVAAWAIADSDSAARSYDEAWYIRWDLVDPMIGPYEARVRRFLTDDPNSLRASYPLQKMPTKRETIGICRSWAHASSKGNSTYAEARQIEVPPSIHPDITIENGDTLSAGQSTNFLEATPNFQNIVSRASMFVAYETKQVRLGLWIVEVTEINCTGVYNGITVPFNAQAQQGVDLPDMGATIPPLDTTVVVTPSGTFSSDNTTITGITSPYAEVLVYNGTTVVGRGVAGTNGNFSILMDVIYSDAVTLTLKAFVNGVASVTTTVTPNDLSPGRPSGTISADGSTVQGVAEPGSTVTILKDAVAQVETLTIPTSQTQIERLTVLGAIDSGGAGDAELIITWPGMTGSPKTITFAVANDDDAAMVASKAAVAAMLDVDVAAFLNVTSDGPVIVEEALVAADHEDTANMALDNDTCTGLTPVPNSTTEQEGSSGVITVSGTAIVTVTSGIASWSPLNIPFFVDAGDDMTDVAAKASAALVLSVANNEYIPSSSTSNLLLTARTVAANDSDLSIAVTTGTCEGLPTSGPSTNTTPGGTAASVVANSGGNYIYSFGVPLSPGDQIAVYASDGGGVSPVLMLEMSATPPTLATAVFLDSDTITGTGTPNGAVVRAYVNGTDIGDTTISAGAFSLNTDYKLVKGEVVEVAVMISGNEDVRSASIFLTAADLNLAVPEPELVTGGYTGPVPAGATQVRVRNVTTLVETTATINVTSNTFFFSIAGQPAGQAFDMYARYATGDSESIRIFVPTIAKAKPSVFLDLGPIAGTYSPGSPLETALGYTADGPWAYLMKGAFQIWMAGMTVTISFPGSSVADIVISSPVENAFYYDLSPLSYALTSYPYGRPANRNAVSFVIPFDLSGPVPLPYPLVKITLTYPDGDEISMTFDRETHHDARDRWADGEWNFAYFNPPEIYRTWLEYYESVY